MPRILLASCLCLFATAAFAVPSVDQCSKGAAPTTPGVAKVHAVLAGANSAPAPAQVASTVPAPDINTHHAGSGAVGTPHVAQPRIISPRWHSFLPGMFR
jgi:hypothetical protein